MKKKNKTHFFLQKKSKTKKRTTLKKSFEKKTLKKVLSKTNLGKKPVLTMPSGLSAATSTCPRASRYVPVLSVVTVWTMVSSLCRAADCAVPREGTLLGRVLSSSGSSRPPLCRLSRATRCPKPCCSAAALALLYARGAARRSWFQCPCQVPTGSRRWASLGCVPERGVHTRWSGDGQGAGRLHRSKKSFLGENKPHWKKRFKEH